MSHHFDTPTALADPRINVCDFYLFRGRPGTTVMALTVNPDAGLSAPDTFREEGLYAFRFDLNGDAVEELAFKVRFGAVSHVAGGEHEHVQNYEILRSTGRSAIQGAEGEVIISGRTGEVMRGGAGVTTFAGLAPDMFAGDAAAITRFLTAFYKDNRFDPAAFQNRSNFFSKRNVTAIVVEVPNKMIGEGRVHAWATASLHGHAPEVQVSRWGVPLFTYMFLPEPGMKEAYNRSVPASDVRRLSAQISKIVGMLTKLAGSSANPNDYGQQLAARICPTILPYELDTPAAFDFVGFNGRALTDDAMDVMLTLATNTALSDGVAPTMKRVSETFPYFGAPYTKAEQINVEPARGSLKKG
jgi:hypothetical protein